MKWLEHVIVILLMLLGLFVLLEGSHTHVVQWLQDVFLTMAFCGGVLAGWHAVLLQLKK